MASGGERLKAAMHGGNGTAAGQMAAHGYWRQCASTSSVEQQWTLTSTNTGQQSAPYCEELLKKWNDVQQLAAMHSGVWRQTAPGGDKRRWEKATAAYDGTRQRENECAGNRRRASAGTYAQSRTLASNGDQQRVTMLGGEALRRTVVCGAQRGP